MSKLGQILRGLREARGLTLKEAAALCAQVGRDSASAISYAYLSRLERGHARNLSVGKMLTLAAIYGRSPKEVIDRLPEVDRARLLHELAEWNAADRFVPRPVWYAPDRVRAMDEQTDALLLTKNKPQTLVPLGHEREARKTIREVILMAALPTFLQNIDGNGKSLAQDWWKLATKRLSTPAGWGWRWHQFTREFLDWLVYERECMPKIAACVWYWNIDLFTPDRIAGQPVNCSLIRDDVPGEYQAREVPAVAVYSARWREAARFLYDNKWTPPGATGDMEAETFRAFGYVPNPIDAVVDYAVYVLLGIPFDPDHTERAQALHLTGAATVMDVLGPFPEDKRPIADNPRVMRVASFLRAAGSAAKLTQAGSVV